MATQAVSDIDDILQQLQRKLVVAEGEVMLDTKGDNRIFVLMVEESRGSAGGRAAGSGSRRVDRVYGFSCSGGSCQKVFETDRKDEIEAFDIPYSAVAMDIRLSDGKPFVVQGVIDRDLITSYLGTIRNLKKA